MTTMPAITHVDTDVHRTLMFHQQVLLDLERCEHGARDGMRCATCPEGVSLGNPLWNRAAANPGLGMVTVMRLTARFGSVEAIPERLVGFDATGDPWVWPTSREDAHLLRRWRP